MKNYKNAIFYLMIPILLTCGVFASLLIDRNSSLREAENKAKTVLTDSAREQTKFFQTRIQAQFAILEAFAELISTKETLDLARFDEVAGYIAKSGDFYHVGVVSSVDGIAHVHTHDSFSAVDRNYFKQALAGKQQIELVIENRVDSVPLFVFSTPMYQNGKIVAVAFGSYDMRKFISLLNSQSYGGASYSYVCDSMGNLIIRSESDTFLLGTNSGKEDAGNNILQLLARAQIAKGYSLDKLHDDLKDGRSGVISFRLDGQYRFAVYEPLDINDWCMFNVIPGEVISAEILAARKSSIVLILVVMSFVLLTLLLIMWREQRNAEGRRTTDARLRSMAERDKLTGLYNRETFVEKARTMIANKPAGSYFMLHCDIDHFKVINDLFGLAAGNTLLCRMAESMQRDIGEKGLCCRITADYFAMLYPNVDTLLEDMPKDYCELSVSGMLPFEITASFGLYVIDDPTLPVESMLDRAALAQQSIKGQYGKLFALYDETMRARMLDVQEVLGSMSTALEQEQFLLYLQPQYNHATGEMIGAEALVRWNHPQKGMIQPGAFIPIIEQSGFIAKLDVYVIEQACKLLRRWTDEGRMPVPLSINVSRADLYNPELCEWIVRRLCHYKLPIRSLRLEITEGAYMENPEQLIFMARKLHSAGFLMDMDDFGSGYSALNTLKDVPVDGIKLDMKFLSSGAGDGRQAKILKHVIGMAKDLGLLVVAEGVETKRQADELLAMDCKLVQGYYYARPMPVDQFDALLKKRVERAMEDAGHEHLTCS